MPGAWSEKEMLNAAKLITTSKKANGGCNCLSAQTVVLPSSWPQKGAFVVPKFPSSTLEFQRRPPN